MDAAADPESLPRLSLHPPRRVRRMLLTVHLVGVGGGLAIASGAWLAGHWFGYAAALGWVVCGAAALGLYWQLGTRREEGRLRGELHSLLGTAQRQAAIAWAVSHEIRNPLTMIKAAVALLDSREPGPLLPDQQQFVTIIQQQTALGVAICEDLLVQARIDSGSFRLERRPTDLLRLVREVAQAIRPLAEQRGQRILLNLPRLMPAARLDARAIRQALSNLLLNAARHSSPGAMIELKVLDNDHAVVLQVTDSGDGMTPAERAQLFEPFRSGALAADGTGLGMSITRQLVLAHGGTMVVDTRLRAGTSFMITLPRIRG